MSSRVNPGATVSNTAWAPGTPGSPVDTPTLVAPTAIAGGNPDPANNANLNAQFSDWLVYKSGNGIWVGIEETQALLVSGIEQLTGTTWSAVGQLTPGGYGVIEHGLGVGPTFVTWSDFMTHHDWSPAYPYPSSPAFTLMSGLNMY